MSAVTDLAASAPLGVGVLGCADIALRRFLPAAVQSRGVRLVAVASRDNGKAAGVAERFGCAAMEYRELLCSDQIALVYLPLPNHLHEEWVLEALRHGKHVLCEKPLALSAGAVRTLVDSAERNRLLVYENLMYLQHPQHGQVKELLETGRIGTLTGLECIFTIPLPPAGTFRLDPASGGGAFHDLNRYPLSAGRFFLRGRIAEIGSCSTQWEGGLMVSMTATALTDLDERFSFTIAFGQPYRCCYRISGTRGSITLERAFTPPADHACRLEIRRGDSRDTLSLPPHDHFLHTIDQVALLIRSQDYAAEHARAVELAELADRFLMHQRPGE